MKRVIKLINLKPIQKPKHLDIIAKDKLLQDINFLLKYKDASDIEKEKVSVQLNHRILEEMINEKRNGKPIHNTKSSAVIRREKKNSNSSSSCSNHPRTRDDYTIGQMKYIMNTTLKDTKFCNKLFTEPSDLVFKKNCICRNRTITSMTHTHVVQLNKKQSYANKSNRSIGFNNKNKNHSLLNKILLSNDKQTEKIILDELIHLKAIEQKYNYYLNNSIQSLTKICKV